MNLLVKSRGVPNPRRTYGMQRSVSKCFFFLQSLILKIEVVVSV